MKSPPHVTDPGCWMPRPPPELSFWAKRAKRSAVRPADLAFSVASTRNHQSEGILLRCHHFRTLDDPPQSISDAMASREGQRSMTARNEAMSESVSMPGLLGPTVPICKAILSHDLQISVGHSVQMAEPAENAAESEWREQFRERVRQAQGERTAEDMAELLGTSRSAYSKYVGGRGSVMPTRLLPKLRRSGMAHHRRAAEGAPDRRRAAATPSCGRQAVLGLALSGALLLLTGCFSAVRDARDIATGYDGTAPASPLTVETADGPTQFKVRRSKDGSKLIVLLDTGAIKRALAKDFGQNGTALPESPFREAANKRLSEDQNLPCEAGTGHRRQDYLWEFDVVCRGSQRR